MPIATFKLTPKQAQFAAAYVLSGNASEAYRQAYNVGDRTKPSTVWCSASQLLRNPSVNHRIEALRAGRTEQTGITIDTVTEQLRQAYELAVDRGQPGAAVAASMALARLHGLFRSRAEVQARNFVVSATPEGLVVEDKPPEPMTPEAWVAEYGQPAS